jgi:hypothetical protein
MRDRLDALSWLVLGFLAGAATVAVLVLLTGW